MSVVRRLVCVLGLALAGGLLLALAPAPASLPSSLHGAAAWADGNPDTALAALVTSAAGLCWLWLVLGVLLALLGSVPGAVGRCARALLARVTPRAVRRLLELALGLSLAGATVPAWAGAVTTAGAVSPPVAAPAAAHDSRTAVGMLGAVPAGRGRPATLPWAGLPSATQAPSPSPPASSAASPTQAPWPDLGPGAPPATAGQWPDLGPAAPTDGGAVVRPGDCLWGIAESRLGRDASAATIDLTWRRWYAANRAVIGPDPNLVLPGQRLAAPPPDAKPPDARPPDAASPGGR